MKTLRNLQMHIITPILITFFFLSFPVHAQYGGGTGEPENPYLIFSAEQMNTIGVNPNDWDKHFILMSDIDLSINSEVQFNIIGTKEIPFTGVFVGDNHKILFPTYISTETNNVGLFGYVDDPNTEIKNLGLTDVNIVTTNGTNVGSLVGNLQNGSITCCYVKGGSILGNKSVGGLVGSNYNGIITECYSNLEVSGNENIGGLVGQNNNGIISNCYTGSNVYGGYNSQYIGGLVANNNSLIHHCYATGRVSGEEGSIILGGLVATSLTSTINNCFWNVDTSGIIENDIPTNEERIGLTTAQMYNSDTYRDAGWDFVDEIENGIEDIWWIDEGKDYPRLWWELIEYEEYESLSARTALADTESTSEDSATELYSDTPAGTEYFTEHFTSGSDSFDLTNKSIMFTPTTDGTYYSFTVQDITELPTSPIGSTNLTMTDDSYKDVRMSDQKKVKIFGYNYSRFYVGSNGYITFNFGDTSRYDTLTNHFNTKRISVLFDDLDPSRRGVVRWKQLEDRAVVTWENVAEYVQNNSNTFQVEMYFDGRIQLAWLDIATHNGIVGLSRGYGTPEDFQETDFSEYSPPSDQGGEPDSPGSSSGRRNRKK